MSYIVPVRLKVLMWGRIVVQEKEDEEEFCSLLSGSGVPDISVEHFRQTYHKGVGAGYCYTGGTHLPWVIVIFSEDGREIFGTLVHEIVHLVDRLSEAFEVTLEQRRGRALARRLWTPSTGTRSISTSR